MYPQNALSVYNIMYIYTGLLNRQTAMLDTKGCFDVTFFYVFCKQKAT